MILLLFGIIFISFCALILYARWNYGILESLNIPVVKPHFFLGSLSDLHKSVQQDEEVKRYRALGPVYGLYEGRKPQIFVCDPKLIRLIFVKDYEHFRDRGDIDLGHPIPNAVLDYLPYDTWKYVRSNWTRTFSSRRIQQFNSTTKILAEEFTNDLLEECNGKRMTFDSRGRLVTILMDFVTSALFGVQMEDRKDPNNPALIIMREVLCENVRYSPLYNLSLVFPFLKKFFLPFGSTSPEKFRRLILTLFNIRNQNNNNKTSKENANVADSLSEMMSNLSSEEYKNLGITEDTIMAYALELFFAIYDSTGTAMTFLIRNLSQNPEIQDRVCEEVDSVFEGQDQDGKTSTEKKFPYLTACWKETLRLTPPFLRPERICTKDWEHDGLLIPKGMTVMIPIFAANRNADIWENPDHFDPQRFLSDNAESDKVKHNPYGFTTFGFGLKMCPGTKVASEIALIILSRLFKDFRFEGRSESQKVEFKPGTLFFIQYKPIFVDIVPRNE